jgi:hypothetical protein
MSEEQEAEHQSGWSVLLRIVGFLAVLVAIMIIVKYLMG